MISVATEQRVRELLEEGSLSQRKIAALTGVSRASVCAIASGKRRFNLASAAEDHTEFFSLNQPLQRCAGCGGLVYPPCHACHVRAFVARRSKQSQRERANEPAGVACG